MSNSWKNNKDKPLSLEEQRNSKDGSLTIYRTHIKENPPDIEFYGLSKSGIKCYKKKKQECPIYYKWILSSDIIENIVDLHKPENRHKIEENITPENKELIQELLFWGELPENNSNRKKLSRHTEEHQDDIKLGLIL